MEFLAVLGWAAFGIALLAAIPAQIVGLPGTWIIFVNALVLRLLSGEARLDSSAVVLLGAAAVAGEVMEFYASAAGARSQDPLKGSTVAAVAGAILGGIAGAPFLFGIGAIPGMAAGAFLAVFTLAMIVGRGTKDAFGIGYGALVGRLKGTAVKILIAVVMLIFLVVSLIF